VHPPEPGKAAEPGEPSYYATGYCIDADRAAIAYTVRRVVPGPNGESQQAFVLCTSDRGATWRPLPLVRTVASLVRFWGFPVWPPEFIAAIGFERGRLQIGFRDEWVVYEPGGESLWSGSCSARGLWSVRRVRPMDYPREDASAATRRIELNLPREFASPPASLTDALAFRLARDVPSSTIVRYSWWLAVLCAAPVAVWGPGWRAFLSLGGLLAAATIGSLLIERRRSRRALML
jgi:hypothetical protein